MAEEFGHFGETFSSGERGDGGDGTPKVGEVATADGCSDALEKPLAKGGKAVYSEHRTFRLCCSRKRELFWQTNHSEMSTF
jgi:hypothetical protein